MGVRRWPRRREMLSYYLLYKYAKAARKTRLNFGEAVDVLEALLGSKRLASAMVRRLVRMRFLEKTGELEYQVQPPEALLDKWLLVYLSGRLRRRGIEASAEEPGVLVLSKEACEKLGKLREAGVRIVCR